MSNLIKNSRILRRLFKPQVRERIRLYVMLMRLDRPIGIMLLLWPTLWALWIAGAGRPDWLVVVVFVLGVLLMRSAGCVINDIADRKYDPYVKRTQDRPLAAGLLHPAEAFLLFIILCLIAFDLVLLMNRLTILLAFAALLIAAAYPFMKRYHHLPQVHLGLAFGWSVPMAFAAETGDVPRVAWLLLIATVLWATAYDMMYAMVDRDDDVKIGVKSTAILFGENDTLIIAVIQAILMLVLLLIGNRLELGIAWYLGLAAATGFAVYQQYLIRDRERVACFSAFLNNDWFGAAVFAGLVFNYNGLLWGTCCVLVFLLYTRLTR